MTKITDPETGELLGEVDTKVWESLSAEDRSAVVRNILVPRARTESALQTRRVLELSRRERLSLQAQERIGAPLARVGGKAADPTVFREAGLDITDRYALSELNKVAEQVKLVQRIAPDARVEVLMEPGTEDRVAGIAILRPGETEARMVSTDQVTLGDIGAAAPGPAVIAAIGTAILTRGASVGRKMLAMAPAVTGAELGRSAVAREFDLEFDPTSKVVQDAIITGLAFASFEPLAQYVIAPIIGGAAGRGFFSLDDRIVAAMRQAEELRTLAGGTQMGVFVGEARETVIAAASRQSARLAQSTYGRFVKRSEEAVVALLNKARQMGDASKVPTDKLQEMVSGTLAALSATWERAIFEVLGVEHPLRRLSPRLFGTGKTPRSIPIPTRTALPSPERGGRAALDGREALFKDVTKPLLDRRYERARALAEGDVHFRLDEQHIVKGLGQGAEPVSAMEMAAIIKEGTVARKAISPQQQAKADALRAKGKHGAADKIEFLKISADDAPLFAQLNRLLALDPKLSMVETAAGRTSTAFQQLRDIRTQLNEMRLSTQPGLKKSQSQRNAGLMWEVLTQVMQSPKGATSKEFLRALLSANRANTVFEDVLGIGAAVRGMFTNNPSDLPFFLFQPGKSLQNRSLRRLMRGAGQRGIEAWETLSESVIGLLKADPLKIVSRLDAFHLQNDVASLRLFVSPAMENSLRSFARDYTTVLKQLSPISDASITKGMSLVQRVNASENADQVWRKLIEASGGAGSPAHDGIKAAMLSDLAIRHSSGSPLRQLDMLAAAKNIEKWDLNGVLDIVFSETEAAFMRRTRDLFLVIQGKVDDIGASLMAASAASQGTNMTLFFIHPIQAVKGGISMFTTVGKNALFGAMATSPGGRRFLLGPGIAHRGNVRHVARAMGLAVTSIATDAFNSEEKWKAATDAMESGVASVKDTARTAAAAVAREIFRATREGQRQLEPQPTGP